MRRVLVLRIIFSAFFPLPLIAMVLLMAAFLVVAPDFRKGDFNYSGSVAVEDVTAGDNPGVCTMN
jgi:hypothetical protein